MKYKLKEDFAGKKAGDILNLSHPEGTNEGYLMDYWFYKGIRIEITRNSSIIEEVKEKEWEILSFKDKYSNRILSIENHDLYNGQTYTWSDTINFCLNKASQYWNIHSVKRLSDGEVFTIGDYLSNNGEDCRIERIGFDNPYLWLYYRFPVDGELYKRFKKDYTNSIQEAKKYIPKKPLFTTEDGVEIFEDKTTLQLVYTVSKKSYSLSKWHVNDSGIKNKMLEGNWIFSNEQNAKDYILMNKPCLSLKDVERYVSGRGNFSILIERVKEKLNQ